jgi:hypothetical protein
MLSNLVTLKGLLQSGSVDTFRCAFVKKKNQEIFSLDKSVNSPCTTRYRFFLFSVAFLQIKHCTNHDPAAISLDFCSTPLFLHAILLNSNTKRQFGILFESFMTVLDA